MRPSMAGTHGQPAVGSTRWRALGVGNTGGQRLTLRDGRGMAMSRAVGGGSGLAVFRAYPR